MSAPVIQLNDQQAAAVQYTAGPLLVLAGAGSGKTRVIIEKIVHLVQHKGMPAQKIAGSKSRHGQKIAGPKSGQLSTSNPDRLDQAPGRLRL